MDKFMKLKILAIADNLMSEQGSAKHDEVPGTHFTDHGVQKFMALLKERAEKPNAPGGPVAVGLLDWLSQKEDGDADVHGASLAQLQRFSKRVTAIRERLKG